jgi:hypothetical protein
VYRVHGVIVGGTFTPIRVYLSTVKNRQKLASFHRRISIKAGAYILENTPMGEGDISRYHFGGKNMKKRREKGGNVKEKGEKGRKGKENEKRGSKRVK